MTDTSVAFGDPLSEPFWQAASEHRLVMQRCHDCGRFQFPPRPYCLSCDGDQIEWAEVSGLATVYSQAVVHVQVRPELEPPYTIALVDLAEGPRLLTQIVGSPVEIGDEVELTWASRAEAPPLPVFRARKESQPA